MEARRSAVSTCAARTCAHAENNRLAVKELNLSYHNSDTILYHINYYISCQYPYHGNVSQVPQQQPWNTGDSPTILATSWKAK